MQRPGERMTVLQVLPGLDVGGAERGTVDVAAALVAAGHRALVMSSGGSMVESLVRSGAEHFECDAGSKNPWIVWKNRQRLIDFIKAENVDLVHARSRMAAWSAYFATRAPRVPFVTTFHNAYSGRNAVKRLYNSVMARGDRVIAISYFIAEHIRTQYGAAPERIAVIRRGIDFSVFSPAAVTMQRREEFRAFHAVPPNVPLIVMPARLSSAKGHALALRALSRLDGHSFLCLVIGPDQGRTAYRQHLLALTRSLRLHDKVRFIERTDLPAAYALADLVLSASQKEEGFGRVPVEAQAMGVPVVATKVGATSETILDGETGWLVPPGDAQGLADAIASALSLSREQRRVMADRAMQHVRAHFDVKQMCAATLALYADLVGAPRCATRKSGTAIQSGIR
jgi:glycosyltransferase involved in cell wall biosynthesis